MVTGGVRRQPFARTGDDARQVEQYPSRGAIVPEDEQQEGAVATANVNDCLRAREIIGGDQCGGDGLCHPCHLPVEGCLQSRIGRKVGKQPTAEDGIERCCAGLYRLEQGAPCGIEFARDQGVII